MGQIISLVLTRSFHVDRLKVTALQEVETAIRLVIKSWFVDVGLSTSDSIWCLLFLFNNAKGEWPPRRSGHNARAWRVRKIVIEGLSEEIILSWSWEAAGMWRCEGRVTGRGKSKDQKIWTGMVYLKSRKDVRGGWSSWAKVLES